jgi:hypothetical protein
MDNIISYFDLTDVVIKQLTENNMWRLKPLRERDPINVFHLYSNMRGFDDGRYRLVIVKLGRRIEGKKYKISIYYTPYNPFNLVSFQRFDNFDELVKIIGDVNEFLLDTNRAYE